MSLTRGTIHPTRWYTVGWNGVRVTVSFSVPCKTQKRFKVMCSYAPKVSFYLCLRTFFPLSRMSEQSLLCSGLFFCINKRSTGSLAPSFFKRLRSHRLFACKRVCDGLGLLVTLYGLHGFCFSASYSSTFPRESPIFGGFFCLPSFQGLVLFQFGDP